MKRLIILLFVLASTLSEAQTIPIPLSNRPSDIYLRDTNIVIGTLPTNTGQVDSFGYVTNVFPSFIADNGLVTMQQVDNLWNNRKYKNNEYILNGLVYKPDNDKWFAALRNRKGIAMFQKVRIYEPRMAEMSDPKKFWYLYEYMIDNNIPNETFWNAPQVDSIVNPVIIVGTPQDSIQ
jgi:hypothetical protein